MVTRRALGLTALLDRFEADPEARLYLRPAGPLPAARNPVPDAAMDALPLAGGPFVFTLCEVLVRSNGAVHVARAGIEELRAGAASRPGVAATRIDAILDRLSAPRPPFAGLDLSASAGPAIMGVVNVTPDSFSDGGLYLRPAAAIAHGRALMAAGSRILDIGGESTRPGAEPVTVAEELRRVIPVIEGLAAEGGTISVDTRRARVMETACAAGARIVNDVTALAGDPRGLETVAGGRAAVVLMHMRGEPRDMQSAPRYMDAPLDLFDFLEARIDACLAAGMARADIAVDPGIGFGKTVDHNVQILSELSLFHGLGCVLVLGVSRKRFIAALGGDAAPAARLPGSLAAGLAGLGQGVQILRVHDVAETAQAIAVWRAVVGV
ncbi:MAG: dihydropteroate synthase [Alphaproteobacteria bacterium]